MVVPFLSERSVDLSLFQTVQKSSTNGLDSLDKSGLSVDGGISVHCLVILGGIVKDSGFGFGDGFFGVDWEED